MEQPNLIHTLYPFIKKFDNSKLFHIFVLLIRKVMKTLVYNIHTPQAGVICQKWFQDGVLYSGV
jgi:hypothetical protein